MTRCAVVNESGLVINVIMADPVLDSLSGYSLILCDENTIIGNSWNGSSFELGPEQLDEKNAKEKAELEVVEQEALEE